VLQALIAHVADDGTTILFSSHHIAEIEQIADGVTIIDRGRNAASGTLDDLGETHCRVQLVFDLDAPDVTFDAAFDGARVRREGRVLTVFSRQGAQHIVDEGRRLGASSTDVFPMTLKDIFFETTAED